MATKLKVSEIHKSKILSEIEVQAALLAFKEKAEVLQFPKELIDFDDAVWMLVVNNLKNVPPEEIKRLYGEKTVAELIQDTLEADRKWPERQAPMPCYVR